MKEKSKYILTSLDSKRGNFLVFFFFSFVIFFLYRDLFGSYFEADEWYHFTYYFPLVKEPNGFITAFMSTFSSSGALSGGQHVVPIASAIFFLNSKFFGLNFMPYAFMSLLLHSINAFLIFIFVKISLQEKDTIEKNLFAFLSGIFFVLCSVSMHAVTGAAPFYGQNILSVTFFLLCIIAFKQAYLLGKKKFIYYSIFFLLLAIFTKETAVFLFFLLPVMAFIEKKKFSKIFLGRIFISTIVIYLIIRFIVPIVYSGVGQYFDKWLDGYIYSTYSNQKMVSVVRDTNTIVSSDLSIYKNLPGEVVFRTIIFPIRMTGTLFLARPVVEVVAGFLTPIVLPIPSIDDPAGQLAFRYGPGNNIVIYILSILILIFCANQAAFYYRKQEIGVAKTLVTGVLIIILSALPLVAIVLSFPRWGTDSYFDSRFYYNPSVGGAIVFPFLLYGIARFINRFLQRQSILRIVIILFTVWLVYSLYIFSLSANQFMSKFGSDRRRVVEQLGVSMPVLSQKTVFYIETDGKSAFGPVLPFFTSVPQALTLAYYDKSPLPDSFFNKPLFDGKAQGYDYAQNRGFGYFYSKKELSSALLSGEFEVNDIHAFYFDSVNAKLSNITSKIRTEMEQYKKEAKSASMWKISIDSSTSLRLKYASDTKIDELQSADPTIVKILKFKNSALSGEMVIMKVPPEFNLDENINFLLRTANSSANPKNVHEVELFFDKYSSNKVHEIDGDLPRYFLRINDILIYIKTENSTAEGIKLVERIIGSLEIINEKK